MAATLRETPATPRQPEMPQPPSAAWAGPPGRERG
jgi:hypothetical protein